MEQIYPVKEGDEKKTFVPTNIIDYNGLVAVNEFGEDWLADERWTELVMTVLKLTDSIVVVFFKRSDDGSVNQVVYSLL